MGSERSCLGSPVRWYQTGLFHHWPPMDQGEEPVKLYEGSKERQHFRDLGDLFAVITAIDKLDHSYTRGAISAAEYTPACATLLGQYKTIAASLSGKCPDVFAFMDEYRLDCQMARKRITIGVPITTEHGGGDINTTERRAIADATGLFITFKDFLIMNYEEGANVDETVPLLRSLITGLNKITRLPFDKAPLIEMMTKLNGMGATDLLEEKELREMNLVIEKMHQDFDNALDSMK